MRRRLRSGGKPLCLVKFGGHPGSLSCKRSSGGRPLGLQKFEGTRSRQQVCFVGVLSVGAMHSIRVFPFATPSPMELLARLELRQEVLAAGSCDRVEPGCPWQSRWWASRRRHG
mmetsp:Transcript_139417/g.445920  ORF Transcript_139417/g.445920 Transcript_139417/m.445920 type:complete len:114 (+) Transcript_139417:1128-1469(+)